MLFIEMGKMFDMLATVNPDKDSWCFNVRVIRLWTVYSTTEPGHLNSLEMIIIDEKVSSSYLDIFTKQLFLITNFDQIVNYILNRLQGTKIHASIDHKLLYLFRHKIFEGSVYNMSNFKVALEEGLNRTTSHPYHLHFLYKTKVDKCEDRSIEKLGLSLTTIGNIRGYGPDHEFLVG
jgi:hypothetical protein